MTSPAPKAHPQLAISVASTAMLAMLGLFPFVFAVCFGVALLGHMVFAN